MCEEKRYGFGYAVFYCLFAGLCYNISNQMINTEKEEVYAVSHRMIRT